LPTPTSRHEADLIAAQRRERVRQLRGLLIIAAILIAFVLIRSRPLHLFAPNWWRL
jgi:hypothetical protein